MSDKLFPVILLLAILCALAAFYSIWLIVSIRSSIRRYGETLKSQERKKGG